MEAKFSPRVKDVISFSREEALRLGNDFIGVEHLLLGIIREGDGKAVRILKEFHLDLQSIRQDGPFAWASSLGDDQRCIWHNSSDGLRLR